LSEKCGIFKIVSIACRSETAEAESFFAVVLSYVGLECGLAQAVHEKERAV